MFWGNSQKLFFPNLKSLTGFWICPFLNRHSLTWRVTSRSVLYETYLEHCLLLQIQTYSGIFSSYLDIFSQIVIYLEICVTFAYSEPYRNLNLGIFKTRDIFRTLSRHILAYPERCVTLAYWEPCIFRTLPYPEYCGILRTLRNSWIFRIGVCHANVTQRWQSWQSSK